MMQYDELRFNEDYTVLYYTRDDRDRVDDGSKGLLGCTSYYFPRRIPIEEAKNALFEYADLVLSHKVAEKKYLSGMRDDCQTAWDRNTDWQQLLLNLRKLDWAGDFVKD